MGAARRLPRDRRDGPRGRRPRDARGDRPDRRADRPDRRLQPSAGRRRRGLLGSAHSRWRAQPTSESLEVRSFGRRTIPWPHIAFQTTAWAIARLAPTQTSRTRTATERLTHMASGLGMSTAAPAVAAIGSLPAVAGFTLPSGAAMTLLLIIVGTEEGDPLPSCRRQTNHRRRLIAVPRRLERIPAARARSRDTAAASWHGTVSRRCTRPGSASSAIAVAIATFAVVYWLARRRWSVELPDERGRDVRRPVRLRACRSSCGASTSCPPSCHVPWHWSPTAARAGLDRASALALARWPSSIRSFWDRSLSLAAIFERRWQRCRAR